jgi:hypothetical protein
VAHPVLTVEDAGGAPTVRFRVTCSGCGAVVAEETLDVRELLARRASDVRELLDVRVPRDGDELGARHAAAWGTHTCPEPAA